MILSIRDVGIVSNLALWAFEKLSMRFYSELLTLKSNKEEMVMYRDYQVNAEVFDFIISLVLDNL
jgi:hypothetical protein